VRGILAASALLVALSPSHLRAPKSGQHDAGRAYRQGQASSGAIDHRARGPTYLDIRESNCEGRLAQFGHSGELTGYTPFKVYWRYPDKNRTDFSKKGVIVNVYNGDRGWTLDKGGVSELSNAAVADFQEQAKRTSTTCCARA